MAGIGCMLWCVGTHMVCGGPDCLRNGQVVLIRSLFPTTHWWEPPQTEVTINRQKAELWHAICVCSYSICVCTFTLEGPNEYIFCVFLCQKQVENCVHTTVESPSHMLIKCEPVYCRNNKYSVILRFAKPNQWFTVLLFNIYQSWLPRQHCWAS